MYEYEKIKRITYGDTGAVFIPVCSKCNRFVKADESIKFNIEGVFKRDEPNATCSKCGRVQMIFEGYY